MLYLFVKYLRSYDLCILERATFVYLLCLILFISVRDCSIWVLLLVCMSIRSALARYAKGVQKEGKGGELRK